MIIRRDLYLNRLIAGMNNGLVKVVTGIRRCGKSFLLFNLFVEYLRSQGVDEKRIIRISLDDDDFAAYRDSGLLYSYIKERIADEGKNYYVLIDEAQFAISREELKNREQPIRLYGVLNGLLRRGNVDVYITGSNSKFLSSDVMTEFRGRGQEIKIAPLSFAEFVSAYGGDRYEAWKEYSLYGGLPHILEEKSEEAKVNYLKHLNSEIYLKDITERYGNRNESGLEELMKTLASSIGSLTNPQRILNTFESNGIKDTRMPTISKFLNELQEAFIVEKAERYDIKGRKYISTPVKYYYTDIGLRNALLNFRQYEETHIMENILYNELVNRGFNVDVGVVEINCREEGKNLKKQLEIDFVANLGNRRYYIQSAYAIPDNQKLEQEQNPLVRIPDSFKKIIVVYANVPLQRTEKGITVIGLFDFLLNPDSLDL